MSNKVWEVFALILSLVLAFKFFGGSVWMMSIIYGVFLLYIRDKKEEWKYEKKYLIARGISTLGLLVLVIGNLKRNDMLTILGGALVTLTLVPIVILDFHYYYIKPKK